MHPILNIAVKAARRAGSIILRHADQIDRLTVESKSRTDFVSEVDRQAEQEIIRIVHAAYPGHAIFAEESGRSGDDETVWIIDPLDGTTNYLHGFPQYAVSIGVQTAGRLEHAVVFDPLRDELFIASRGQGTLLNDRRVRVSRTRQMHLALLGTGFPYKDTRHLDEWIAVFRALMPLVSGIRRAGSAALDLAYVASGRLDGFWEIGLNPWDMAGGVLLIQEAGGFVSDMDGQQRFLDNGHVLCGSQKVYEEMLLQIRKTLGAIPASVAP